MSADAMGVTHCVKHMNISLIISVYFRTTRYHKDIIFKSSDLLHYDGKRLRVYRKT